MGERVAFCPCLACQLGSCLGLYGGPYLGCSGVRLDRSACSPVRLGSGFP